ncbi:MAG TPA: hypothetical protein DG577_02970, partial [Firmicutes bacterium]|nr:hypothetical protein [Bacillota bacterium]
KSAVFPINLASALFPCTVLPEMPAIRSAACTVGAHAVRFNVIAASKRMLNANMMHFFIGHHPFYLTEMTDI